MLIKSLVSYWVFKDFYFWSKFNFSVCNLFNSSLLLAITSNEISNKIDFAFLSHRRNSIRFWTENTIYISKTKAKWKKKFHYLTIFNLVTKKNPKKQNKNIQYTSPLTPHITFSKVQFFLDPSQHPFTGTKFTTNAIELKWKKSWDSFLRSFFVKKPKFWYHWDNKIKKTTTLYKALTNKLAELALFLYQNPVKQFKKKRPSHNLLTKQSNEENPIKPFFLNHMFYVYKLRLAFNKLKFIARHFRSEFPKNFTKFKFKSPYFYLNIAFSRISEIKSLLPTIIQAYKSSRKFAKTIRRGKRFVKQHVFKKARRNIHLLQPFNIYELQLPGLNLLKKDKYKRFARIKVMTPLHHQRLFLKTKNYIFENKVFFSINSLFSLKKKVRKIFIQIKRKTFFKYKLSRFFKRLNKFIKHLRYFKNIIKKPRIAPYILAFRFTPKTTPTKNFSNLLVSNTLKKKKISILNRFNKLITNDIKKDLSSGTVFFDLKIEKIFIKPEFGLVFVLPSIGFLSLTKVLPFTYFHSSLFGVHKLRRLKHSFVLRNELPKHILRKYNYARVSLTYYEPHRLRQKFYGPLRYKATKPFFKGNEENWADTFFYNLSIASSFLYKFSNLSSSTLTNFQNKFTNKTYRKPFTIFSTRFKPGYMRLWRRARVALQIRTKTFFRYQHQLTSYLLIFRRGVHLPTSATDEFRLQNLLIKARFVFDKTIATTFIIRKLVFVNGINCSNEKFQLCAGDFLQLIVSFKYYITFRWLLNHCQKLKFRIKKLSKKLKKKKAARNPDKKYAKRTPEWVSRHLHLFSDISKYMEVDFFTLSAFLLHDPLFWTDINVYEETILKPQIFNMYNWKYIT